MTKSEAAGKTFLLQYTVQYVLHLRMLPLAIPDELTKTLENRRWCWKGAGRLERHERSSERARKDSRPWCDRHTHTQRGQRSPYAHGELDECMKRRARAGQGVREGEGGCGSVRAHQGAAAGACVIHP